MINKNNKDFSEYGSDFQIKLAKIIANDSSFSNQIREVLDIEYFDAEYLKLFINKIFEYKDKYKCHPSIEAIESIFNTSVIIENKVHNNIIKGLIGDLKSNAKIIDENYVRENSLLFCKTQKIKEALGKGFIDLENGNIDKFRSTLDEAFKLGIDLSQGHDYLEEIEKRYEIDVRSVITTGWDSVNSLLKGGFGEREVQVYIAPTGKGKSSRMVYTGAANLCQGKNVIYYSCELRDSVIGRRFDSCITGIKLDDLDLYKDEIKKAVRKLIKGRLFIKEYPMYSISAKTIENHLEKLRQKGIEFDLVIIDYADLLIPSGGAKDDLAGGVTVFQELVSMAQRLDLRILTAAQTNRAAESAETITFQHVQDAYKRYAPVDFVMSFAPTGNSLILKNRNGPHDVLLNETADFSRLDFKLTSMISNHDFKADINSIDPAKSSGSIEDRIASFVAKHAIKTKAK